MTDDLHNDCVRPDMPVFEGTTLDEAKLFVQQQLVNGVVCPCCAQYAKVYKRALYSTLASSLCLIYQHFVKNPGHDWVHIAQFLVETKGDSSIAGGDVIKTRYWGLIEEPEGEKGDGNPRVGRWRLTDLGRAFVEMRVSVPKYVYLYNGRALRFSDEMVNVREALGLRFNYEQIMARAVP